MMLHYQTVFASEMVRNNEEEILTSGQSNLTKGRIAATSFGPPESRNQTASQSVQPFLHSSPQNVFGHAWARPFC